MKLLAYALLLVFAASGLNKCDSDVEGKKIDLNDQFELHVEKTAILKSEKLGLTFTSLQESRCPKGTSCIRAGEAKVNLQVTNAAGETQTLTLESKGNCEKQDGSCGQSKKILGYSIKLINVNPYPGSGEKSEEGPKAVLEVSK